MTTNAKLHRLKRLIADVPGWLTEEEAEALFGLAEQCSGKGVIVEIGSWKGRSTICLALGSQSGSGVPVYAIDPHTEYRFGEFKANIARAGVEELVTAIPGLSQEKADTFDEPIELLWIDGSHDYDLVKEDFEKWVPKVVEGGFVGMHDTTWHDGPRRVADRRILSSPLFKDARFVVGATTIARKTSRAGVRDRLRSLYVLAVKTVFRVVSTLLRAHRNRLPKRLELLGRRVFGAIQ